MNKGKSYEYFRWASQNATMHVDPARLALHPPTNLSLPDRPSPALLAANGPAISSPFPVRRPDYVVKADDDTFIIPRELERHLRATPRERSYWGYVVKHRFMGGESYALSTDLVDWMAHSQTAARMKVGPEDHRTALMLGKYPGNVTWTNERCWIYDHPQAGTVSASDASKSCVWNPLSHRASVFDLCPLDRSTRTASSSLPKYPGSDP